MTPPSRTDWRLVILLWLAGLLAAGQFGKVSLTLTELGALYPAAGLALPFAVSVVGLVGIVLGAVSGGLVARAGLRRSVLAALVAGGLLSLIQAAGLPLWLLLLTRAAEGMSHLALVVAAPSLMIEASRPRDHPVVMGLWGTFFGVAFALITVILPPLLARGGLPLVFAVHGGAMLAAAVLLLPVLPARRVRETGEFELGRELREIYADPRAMAPGLIFLWHTLTYVALLTFLPDRLGVAGLAVALPLVALAATMGAGVAAKRIAPLWLAVAGFAATLGLAAAMLVLPDLRGPLAPALFVAIGVVPGASFAAIPWFNTDLSGRARANGALAQMGNVGTFCGTPLFALALSAGGTAGLFALTGLLAAGGLAIVAALRLRLGRIRAPL
ncbi:MFS transporter [Mesobaculum littorinae]|uniref:MFS transporter n=1 Tax=Mesobaculum littorinae TaxID=2486419 RepID=A0A438AJQ7_9RHOB|nr:MFS transporter [Mesobaculum littorinae]RVV98884.1 MFS transporter [Mesobaculum littorinae]